MSYTHTTASHATPEEVSSYRRQYSAFKCLSMYSFPGVDEKLSVIRDHPNIFCIRLPATYSRLLNNQPKVGKNRYYENRQRKLRALDDVISFLDSLSIGVIR
jgi:hypothetical protein